MGISLPVCEFDPLERSRGLNNKEIAERISTVKKRLGEKLLILGHHYQRDSIIEHTDLIGDSFLLSKMAAESSSEFIVFCYGRKCRYFDKRKSKGNLAKS